MDEFCGVGSGEVRHQQFAYDKLSTQEYIKGFAYFANFGGGLHFYYI